MSIFYFSCLGNTTDVRSVYLQLLALSAISFLRMDPCYSISIIKNHFNRV